MKMYLFYKVPPRTQIDDETISLDDRFPLYASTNEKDLADEFMKGRNMDRFIIKKKKVTKEGWASFINNHASTRLDRYTFQTSEWVLDKNTNTTKVEWKAIKITTTWAEKEQCTEVVDKGLSDAEIEYVNPFIFKKKYIEALATFQYIPLYKLFGRKYIYDSYETDHSKGIEDYLEMMSSYSAPEISFDEVKLLLLICKDTFV